MRESASLLPAIESVQPAGDGLSARLDVVLHLVVGVNVLLKLSALVSVACDQLIRSWGLGAVALLPVKLFSSE